MNGVNYDSLYFSIPDRNMRQRVPAASALLRMSSMVMVGVIASGSTLRWTIAGLPDALACSKAFGKSAGLLDRDAESAECPRIGGEVRILQRRRDYPAGIFALLMHADGAVNAVVARSRR